MKKSKFALCAALAAMAIASPSFAQSRWSIKTGSEIEWKPTGDSHFDHIEMSGKKVSVVYRYGIDHDGRFNINKSMVWPMLRTIPNNTHASLMRRFDWNPISLLVVNGLSNPKETIAAVRINGTLEVESLLDWGYGMNVRLTRRFFPSTTLPASVEKYTLVNSCGRPLAIEIPNTDITYHTDAAQGVDGSYTIKTTIDKSGVFVIAPADSLTFTSSIAGYKPGEAALSIDADKELAARRSLVAQLSSQLVLETPDTTINTMFNFSKTRACESIYQTAGGPMHGPGGESYYAAIWANDQAEYINPYFPFTGYDYGCQSAFNAFKHFARFINKDWSAIPSSIIAEGKDIWNGCGDRGDAAMIAYGASRYALARGSKSEASQLWSLIEWCLEYCRRQLTPEGVVASDTDELEGRFPSGKANLCTSSLYYDALLSASMLAKELGKPASVVKDYRTRANTMRQNIDKYFGAKVEGFDTYAYYKGNDTLRSWICIPLTVGIETRAQGTIKALLSPRLFTKDGLLTLAGDVTFWDRSTLYALRGIYAAGETATATRFLHDYSATRLLGEHVPYAIEAWPEGEQRHLSAESGLYGRVITEGLFGIRPTGFRSFSLTPHLPDGWNNMALRKIRAFESDFDIEISRAASKKISITVKNGKRTVASKVIKSGQSISVKL